MEQEQVKTCATCGFFLGGNYSFCRKGLERECAEGGYEAWEPKLLEEAMKNAIAEV